MAHPEIQQRERLGLLKIAQRATGKSKIKVPSTQRTLFSLVGPSSSSSSEEVEPPTRPEVDSKSTRSFSRYDIDTEPSLMRFRKFLTSIDGKKRSDKTAKEISADVSKFLRFACGDREPDWTRLLDRDMLNAFVSKLETAGIGPDGMVAKLESMECGLTHFRITILKDDPTSPLYRKAQQISEVIQQWRSVYRKEKVKLRASRLEEQSGLVAPVDEVTKLATLPQAWEFYRQVVSKSTKNITVAPKDLDTCTMLLANAVMTNSCQRPGAVINLTISEYQRRVDVKTREGDKVEVIRVAEHKTAQVTSAKLLLNHNLAAHMRSYLSDIRPLQAVSEDDHFFIVTGGYPISQFNNRMKIVAKSFGLCHYTATEMRKSIATQAALTLDDKDRAIVTKQLSHSKETDDQYYALVAAPRHAVSAYSKIFDPKTGRARQEEPCSSREFERESFPAKKGKRARKPFYEDTSDEGIDPEPIQKRKRIPFSEDETEKITSYFSTFIRSSKTPSLQECKKFLDSCPLPGRSAKNIQDKVKNIIKQ